jgi:hypothetical protein
VPTKATHEGSRIRTERFDTSRDLYKTNRSQTCWSFLVIPDKKLEGSEKKATTKEIPTGRSAYLKTELGRRARNVHGFPSCPSFVSFRFVSAW